jgi:hypothetical protein
MLWLPSHWKKLQIQSIGSSIPIMPTLLPSLLLELRQHHWPGVDDMADVTMTLEEYEALRAMIGMQTPGSSPEPGATPKKRSGKARASDKKLSRAFREANAKMRLKNGQLRKGRTQADVARLAQKLRKKMWDYESNGQSTCETPSGDSQRNQIVTQGFEEVISEEPKVLESIRLRLNPYHICIEDTRESPFERSPRV